ncbi:hypothetical protein ACE10Z_06885 [Bradyrhizobium sp. Pha-3]
MSTPRHLTVPLPLLGFFTNGVIGLPLIALAPETAGKPLAK